MPRVVPSQVVDLIKISFPNIAPKTLGRGNAGQLRAMVSLIDAIPDQLLLMDSEAYAKFVCGVGQVKHTLECWANDRDYDGILASIPGFQNVSPVWLILDALEKCPDEAPAQSTAELNFIADKDEALRTNLRTDIAAVDTALANREWKAATVLAGSVIEALLLWDIKERRKKSYQAAVAALVKEGIFDKKPSNNPEDWVLHHYIEVAAHLEIIKPKTAIEARLAKDFRNLIHPGRAQRFSQQCNRGTALSCVAALEHVVEDLKSSPDKSLK